MIRNFDEITSALFDKMDQYRDQYGEAAFWPEHAEKDMTLKFIKKLWRTYNRAYDNAKNFGYVGVGCITYAENRVQEYQKRLAAKIA